MPRWTRPPASLTLTDDLALAELPDPTGRLLTHALPHRMLGEAEWGAALARQLGPGAVAEARAWLAEFRLPVMDRVRPKVRGRLGDRPVVARSGRGWRLLGRRVVIDAGPSFDIGAALPERHGLPAEVVGALAQLASLPCPCATGARSAEEHGELRLLAVVEEGGERAEVGRCAICGRAWLFQTGRAAGRASFDGSW
jgi:hypothetical protein